MIERKNWISLNFKEIQNHNELLEEFPGYLPLILLKYTSNIKRNQYLTNNKLYNTVTEKTYNKRLEFKKAKDKGEWLIEDVLKWVNENPFFEILIKTN